MSAQPVPQVASSASGAAGWLWLHCAAEMAARASADGGLPAASDPAVGDPDCGPPAIGQASLGLPGSELMGSGLLGPGALALGWTCFPRVAMRTPGLGPGAISAARRFASLTMRRWGVTDREDDIAVVVSEMLSNAVRHGLQAEPGDQDHPIRLGLLHAGPSVMCAVADPSAQPPVPREPCWLDESGRGLHVISSLSDLWGCCAAPGEPGKVVWACFTTSS